ncbi:site-2 protease family protein [Candidatus Saccharibacteria bacterium]|nr:site-2 protease family protein [Candidatus Saccharibacteria bacterium]
MDLSFVIIAILVLVVAMILHEFAHGLVAYWLGDDTAKENGRLSLNPFAHFDLFLSFLLPVMMIIMGGPVIGGAKPVPINTTNLKFGVWGMALVAISGPLTNFILSFIGFAVLVFTSPSGIMLDILSIFVQINLSLAIFNMFPIPPLDGSRVLYALAPDYIRPIFDKIEQFGFLLILAIFFLGGTVIAIIISTVMHWILTELFPRLLFLY